MKVKFMPQDVEFEIESGQSVLGLAHEKGIPIHSTCNGMPSCAECRVRVIEGEHNLLPPSKKEIALIGTGYYIDRRRLACQMVCFGDVIVDTQEHLDRMSSGHVTKKFLSRVQKESAEQSHSVGDVLIQKDDELLKQLESSVENEKGADRSATRDHEIFDEMMASQNSKPHSQRPPHPKKGKHRNRNRNRRGGKPDQRSNKSDR